MQLRTELIFSQFQFSRAWPNTYAFAKDTLRRQLEYLRKCHSFALTWARIFYLYGDGQAESSLLPQLKQAVAQGKTLFNMSGGEQLRDYLPVGDVAQNFALLALNRADIGVVNICSGKPISVRKMVESWIDENNWNINLNLGHCPYPDYEPLAFWVTVGSWIISLHQYWKSNQNLKFTLDALASSTAWPPYLQPPWRAFSCNA